MQCIAVEGHEQEVLARPPVHPVDAGPQGHDQGVTRGRSAPSLPYRSSRTACATADATTAAHGTTTSTPRCSGSGGGGGGGGGFGESAHEGGDVESFSVGSGSSDSSGGFGSQEGEQQLHVVACQELETVRTRV